MLQSARPEHVIKCEDDDDDDVPCAESTGISVPGRVASPPAGTGRERELRTHALAFLDFVAGVIRERLDKEKEEDGVNVKVETEASLSVSPALYPVVV